MNRRTRLSAVLVCLLTACVEERIAERPAGAVLASRATISHLIPAGVSDRPGWSADIDAAFAALHLPPTTDNVCAVVAVIDQESGFKVDPVVPNLSNIAWREIEERAAGAGVPRLAVHAVLQLTSPDGRRYSERIDAARTERQLSDIYEDFIGAVPLGRTLFEARNPIRTRGPMQVQVTYAERFSARHRYPYPTQQSMAEELFTRRGGVYFGVAHLLDYPAPYAAYLYRFADFNAGQYASRNAAFQQALNVALATRSPLRLRADGALLEATAEAALALAPRLRLEPAAIRADLGTATEAEFASTPLYSRVFALADGVRGAALPRALLPDIDLKGPKLTRTLSTAWYARRVQARYLRCLER